MANIRGIVGQSTRLASRDGYGGHINFFHYWSDDTQAQCEVPGYLTRRQMPSNYVDGDVIYIFGTGFNQTYRGVTDAATLQISLTAVHGAGSGTVLGDGNISNVQLVGRQLVFTGSAGAFNGPIDLSPIVPLNTVTSITAIDFRPTGVPGQYTVSLSWVDKNGAAQTTTDSTPVTLAPETVTTIVNNGGTSFTYTNELGVSITIPIAAAQTITTLTDQGNGTYVYTSENGTATLIDARGVVTTLVDNLNGTFTYTNELGIPVTISAGGDVTTTLVDNGNATFTYTNELGVPVLYAEEVTTLVNNLNGSFTYTNELGVPTTYTERLSTLVRNADSTLTYTNEAGILTTFMPVNPVNTALLLPNPTTVAAGSLWVVNADTNLAFNGIYKVDGAIGANGVGYTKI